MAVVMAHAAGPDAAERQGGLGDVHHRVVDGDAAGQGFRQHFLGSGPVVVEVVQRQRAIMRVDVGDGLVDIAITFHRQDRAEDLVAHDRGFVGWIEHDGGRNDPFGFGARRVDGGQRDHLIAARAGFVEIAAQAPELALAGDVGVVGVVVQAWIAGGHVAAQRFDEGFALAGMHQRVIRRDAGLAGVEKFAGCNARGCPGQGIAVADDGRGLAAQFQGDRGEIGRGGRHHLAADGCRAGEQQVVQRQAGERGGDIGTAERDRDPVFGKHLGQQVAQEGAGTRGVF